MAVDLRAEEGGRMVAGRRFVTPFPCSHSRLLL